MITDDCCQYTKLLSEGTNPLSYKKSVRVRNLAKFIAKLTLFCQMLYTNSKQEFKL